MAEMHVALNFFIRAARSRSLLTASIAAGVAVVIASSVIFVSHGSGPTSAQARVTNTINEEIAKLNVKPRTVELTSEKAAPARLAIKQGDFSAVRKITADVLANSQLQNWRFYPFNDFIDGILDVSDEALEAQLNVWVAQSKDDAIPFLIRAQYFYQMGWHKRGHRFANETSAASMVSFEGYMRKGFADIEAAIRLNDGNPYSFYLKLRLLRGFGMSQDMKNAFDEAVAKYPGYYPLYELVLSVLEPRWGGTVKAMYAFVDQYAGHAPDFSPLKLLHLDLYHLLLRDASTACRANKNDNDKLAQCTAFEMQKNVTPDLEKQVLAALQLYDHSDKYQFGTAIEGRLLEMLRTPGGGVYAGAILQLAASSMHSNTQLKEERPDQSNYIIDKVAAQSWFAKGFYDNALKKDQQALKNIEATSFPNEEEKELALSRIYDSIAWTYNKLNQYPEIIAYEEAAVTHGGRTAHEYLICYAYYRLKDYDGAVRACTKTIENATEKLQSRYWRGRAYQDLGQPDAALEDFAAVADSDDNLRTYAGRTLSVIYLDRGDFRTALSVLNKYAHLYEPQANSRDNIAVSYNNRCYAYMQLGELEKALDDCTASLRYGSLPDAYRKQMELTKRLKARETDL